MAVDGERWVTRYGAVVPRELEANIRWRRAMLRKAEGSAPLRRQLIRACREDVLFFVSGFAWTHDPFMRYGRVVIPFIPWPFQEDAFRRIDRSIGHHDVYVKKSRGMGATWMFLTAMVRRFLFWKHLIFSLHSYKKELVDRTNDMGALFPKIRFLLEYLPIWMLPDVKDDLFRIHNPGTRCFFTGDAATERVGRGGRNTMTFLDEFAWFLPSYARQVAAGTVATTPCRAFCSTPHGAGTAYALMEGRVEEQIRLHWSVHPLWGRGLYTSRDGQLAVLDKDYRYPPDYQFVLDGKVRSPWYDEERKRYPSEVLAAQELDMEDAASGGAYFDLKLIDRLIDGGPTERTVCPPLHTGELTYNRFTAEPLEWQECDNGRWRLWCPLDAAGRPCNDRDYGIGLDVSAGGGASNSTMSIGDMRAGDKVGEFACPLTKPDELALAAVATARFFKNGTGRPAKIIWEENGPGREFTSRVLELGHQNIYYRNNTSRFGGVNNMSAKPGWYSTKDGKRDLLGNYAYALATGKFINHSEYALDECRNFMNTETGEIVHANSRYNIDPSGARDNHGDLVIADAVLWEIMKDHQVEQKRKVIVPRSCIYSELQRILDSGRRGSMELTASRGWN